LSGGRISISRTLLTFHFWTFDQATSPQVIVNGPDPGDLGGAEETEAVLDTTWAGAGTDGIGNFGGVKIDGDNGRSQ
jgi:hypothetical protein